MRRNKASTVFLIVLLLSSFLASIGFFVEFVNAATVFSDGFETNNFSAWSGTSNSSTGTLTTVTAAPHHGTYNMNSTIAASSSDQWASVYYGSLANAYQTLYMRGYGRWNSNPAVNPNILPFLGYWQDPGANSMVRAGVGYNGAVHWGLRYRSGGGFTSVFGSSVPTINTVYCVELMITRSTTGNSDGAVQLWVNGASEISVTGLDNDDRNLNYAYFGFNSFVAAESAAKVFQGDCYVLSTTYIGLEDATAPTFGAITSVNGTDYFPSYGYNYSCAIADTVGISGSISSTNVTGAWVNATWTSAAGATTKTIYITGTHNATKGNTDSYKVYANDTSNNWGTSTQYNFLLTDTFAAWLTYTSLINHYDFLVFQNSSIVSKVIMGNTSVNGVQFYVYKFGTNTSRIMMVDASVHGHEQYSSHAVLWMAQWLVGSANGSSVLSNLQICIVPSMNPDYFGTEHRKNVNDVDLNRNHILGWAAGDSNPSSDYYRGPSAESEPETEALNDLFASLQPNIYVSVHDFGGNLYGNSTDTGGYFKYENYGSATFLANCLNLYNNYTTVQATKGIGLAHLITSGAATGFAYDDAYSIPANDTCLAYLWEETNSATETMPPSVALIRDNKTIHLESFIEGAVNYFNAQISDTTKPTYSAITTNTTKRNTLCNFSATLTDEIALANYTFGTNNTGAWINDTVVAISGLSYVANTTKTLNATVGIVIQWEYWFADSSNNLNNTGVLSNTTTLLADTATLSQAVHPAISVADKWTAVATLSRTVTDSFSLATQSAFKPALSQTMLVSWAVSSKWTAKAALSKTISTAWSLVAGWTAHVNLAESFSSTFSFVGGWTAHALGFASSISTSWTTGIKQGLVAGLSQTILGAWNHAAGWTAQAGLTQTVASAWSVADKWTAKAALSESPVTAWSFAGGLSRTLGFSYSPGFSWLTATKWTGTIGLSEATSLLWSSAAGWTATINFVQPVSNVWNVVAHNVFSAGLSQSIVSSWNILNCWTAKAALSESTSASWNALSTWTAKAGFTQSIGNVWTTLASWSSHIGLLQPMGSSWNVLGHWTVKVELAESATSVWNVLTPWSAKIGLAQPINGAWNVASHWTTSVGLSQSVTTAWNVVAVITGHMGQYIIDLSQSIGTSWNTAVHWVANVGFSQSVAGTWNLLASWSTSTSFSQSISSAWDVHVGWYANVGLSHGITTTWNMLTEWTANVGLTESFTSMWNSAARWIAHTSLSQPVFTAWNILVGNFRVVGFSQSISIGWSTVSQWLAHASLSEQASATWISSLHWGANSQFSSSITNAFTNLEQLNAHAVLAGSIASAWSSLSHWTANICLSESITLANVFKIGGYIVHFGQAIVASWSTTTQWATSAGLFQQVNVSWTTLLLPMVPATSVDSVLVLALFAIILSLIGLAVALTFSGKKQES